MHLRGLALDRAARQELLRLRTRLEDFEFFWADPSNSEQALTALTNYHLSHSLGILDAIMHSAAENNRVIKTPELAIRYQSADWAFARGVPAGEK